MTTPDLDADAARVLQSFAEMRNDNARLRDEGARLTNELAIERARMEQLDASYRTTKAERDFYMRMAVELRSQLTDAATLLTSGVDRARVMAQGVPGSVSAENPTPLPARFQPRVTG